MEVPNYFYEISVVPSDLSRAANTYAVANALQSVDNVMEQVFNSILLRINGYSSQVKELQQRTNLVNQMIEKLKGRKTATQVFSSASYPGRQEYKPFEPLLNYEPKVLGCPEFDRQFHPPTYDPNNLKDKMEFFHVHNRRNKKENKIPKGLGPIPRHLDSVASLLLFNTSHNPYSGYKVIDPLSHPTKKKEVIKPNIENPLFEAPSSLKETRQMYETVADEFRYLPELSDLPEFDLPLQLPSLPGIAHDFTFPFEESPVSQLDNVPELPELPASLPVHESTGPSSFSVSSPPLHSASLTPHSNEILIPPPPVTLIPPPPPPPASIPPPPPPPSIVHRIDTTTARDSKTIPAEDAPNSRSELMKAIQDAGGAGKARLRKVTQKEKDIKNSSNSTMSKTSGGDLMSDLFAKLSQRRKGISGNQNNPKANDANVLPDSDLSFRSRTPVPQHTDSESNVSDDDWD